MNADYQRVLDKAQELHDMLEALANKWQGQGKTADAERLIGVWGSIEEALGTEQESGGPIEPGGSWLVSTQSPEMIYPVKGAVIPNRRKKNEPPPDDDEPTPEGVPA